MMTQVDVDYRIQELSM